jgi:hypothetical protein
MMRMDKKPKHRAKIQLKSIIPAQMVYSKCERLLQSPKSLVGKTILRRISLQLVASFLWRGEEDGR